MKKKRIQINIPLFALFMIGAWMGAGIAAAIGIPLGLYNGTFIMSCMSAILILSVPLMVWDFITLNRAAEQRKMVYRKIAADLEKARHLPVEERLNQMTIRERVLKALDLDSFDLHRERLVFFRDPWSVYDPIVKDYIDGKLDKTNLQVERKDNDVLH